jgi:hypothetical protein
MLKAYSTHSGVTLAVILLALGWWGILQFDGSWAKAAMWTLFVLLHVRAFCG